jgi:hypothetical protein
MAGKFFTSNFLCPWFHVRNSPWSFPIKKSFVQHYYYYNYNFIIIKSHDVAESIIMQNEGDLRRSGMNMADKIFAR